MPAAFQLIITWQWLFKINRKNNVALLHQLVLQPVPGCGLSVRHPGRTRLGVKGQQLLAFVGAVLAELLTAKIRGIN